MENERLKQNLEQIKVLAEECLADLGNKSLIKSKSSQQHERLSVISQLDFTMRERAFVKRYAKGMSGPEKFTLLLACLAKGDLRKNIKLAEIKKYWNRMTKNSLLGMEFNLFYSSEAKEQDWVETKKHGEYNLRPSWKGIFKNGHSSERKAVTCV